MTPEQMMQRMLELALAELGVREVPGKRSNSRIVEYYAAAGIGPGFPGELGADDSTTAWCGCFQAFVVRGVGIEPPPNPFRARQWLLWGETLDVPVPGCAVVFSRGSNPYHGHVATYLATAANGEIAVCGGNQSNSVNAALYAAERVLGYRAPIVPASPSAGVCRQ